jgi:hypothetical protein
VFILLVVVCLLASLPGIVLLATEVLQIHSTVAVAGATLAVAALFNPVRRRVQKLVDRGFNRARYDADRIIAAFAARLQDAVNLDAVRADLASSVQQALEPAHVSVWIGQANSSDTLPASWTMNARDDRSPGVTPLLLLRQSVSRVPRDASGSCLTQNT